MEIKDYIKPSILGEVYEEKALEKEPYLGEGIFKARKQLGVKLAYLQRQAPKIRPLDISTWDAKVQPISREGLKVSTTEMPFFKNSLILDEEQRQNLNMLMMTNNEALIRATLEDVYNDEERLFDNARATKEMLNMQVLTTGAIAFSSNGLSISYDYGVPEENKVKSNWSAADAKPIKDLSKWANAIQSATGKRPTTVLMNSDTLANIAELDSVKNAIYVFAQGTVEPDEDEVRNLIRRRTRLNVITYDKGYTDEASQKFVKFVPDNVVVLFDPRTVGEGVFGTTPEESDLMTGVSSAEVSIVDTGVAVTVTKETDPVQVVTKVSMVYLPVLKTPNEIVIADVSGNNV